MFEIITWLVLGYLVLLALKETRESYLRVTGKKEAPRLIPNSYKCPINNCSFVSGSDNPTHVLYAIEGHQVFHRFDKEEEKAKQ